MFKFGVKVLYSLVVIGAAFFTVSYRNSKGQEPTRTVIESHPDYPISVEVLRNAEDEANLSILEKFRSQRGMPILIEEQDPFHVKMDDQVSEISITPIVLSILQGGGKKIFGIGLSATGGSTGGPPPQIYRIIDFDELSALINCFDAILEKSPNLPKLSARIRVITRSGLQVTYQNIAQGGGRLDLEPYTSSRHFDLRSMTRTPSYHVDSNRITALRSAVSKARQILISLGAQ